MTHINRIYFIIIHALVIISDKFRSIQMTKIPQFQEPNEHMFTCCCCCCCEQTEFDTRFDMFCQACTQMRKRAENDDKN